MAKCYTTSEDLTSIANAIRAKTGSESSLVYPSGFVSAINSIDTSGSSIVETPRNPFGKESLYHLNLLEDSFNLDSINFSNWTPSTTVTNLTTSTRRDDLKFYRDLSNRTGMLKLDYSVKFAYEGETVPNLGGVWFGATFVQYILPRVDVVSNMSTKTKTYVNTSNTSF